MDDDFGDGNSDRWFDHFRVAAALARRLYDERIAPSIPSRDVYFQQELVQTLADGDQSLLG